MILFDDLNVNLFKINTVKKSSFLFMNNDFFL